MILFVTPEYNHVTPCNALNSFFYEKKYISLGLQCNGSFFKIALIEMVLLANTFNFLHPYNSVVEHMLILVVTHVLFVHHPRFGIIVSVSKNKSLLAVPFRN